MRGVKEQKDQRRGGRVVMLQTSTEVMFNFSHGCPHPSSGSLGSKVREEHPNP